MSDHGTGKPPLGPEVETRATRKLRAQRTSLPSVWFGLGMMGLVGWSIAMPTLLGAALGSWLDRDHSGSFSWTLALLVAGLVIGCFNAWDWVAKQAHAMREAEEEDNE